MPDFLNEVEAVDHCCAASSNHNGRSRNTTSYRRIRQTRHGDYVNAITRCSDIASHCQSTSTSVLKSTVPVVFSSRKIAFSISYNRNHYIPFVYERRITSSSCRRSSTPSIMRVTKSMPYSVCVQALKPWMLLA